MRWGSWGQKCLKVTKDHDAGTFWLHSSRRKSSRKLKRAHYPFMIFLSIFFSFWQRRFMLRTEKKCTLSKAAPVSVAVHVRRHYCVPFPSPINQCMETRGGIPPECEEQCQTRSAPDTSSFQIRAEARKWFPTASTGFGTGQTISKWIWSHLVGLPVLWWEKSAFKDGS